MATPLAVPIIGGAASVLSSIFGNMGAARRQRQANRQNIAFWRMQNEYNNPSAQMQRLKAAGLNPNLIYGTSPTSAVGNAQSIAPSKAAPYKIENPLQGVNMYADTRVKEVTTDNLKTQNTVLQQEALLKAAQTAKLGIDTARTKFDLGLATDLRNTSLQAAQEELRKLEAQSFGAELENKFKDKSMQDRLRRVMYEADNAKETLKGTELLNALRQLEKDLKDLGIERSDPWYFRIIGRHLGGDVMQFKKKMKN